jgi:SAM-dependent methyltransferase
VDLDDLAALRSPAGRNLLAALPPYDGETALAVGERLRAQGHDAAMVAAALTQARLRARARSRLGPVADRMYLTSTGLEQATGAAVAALHVRRFAAAGARSVADLCCGVGGDLLPLLAAGLPAVGVDRDPLTAAVAAATVAELGADVPGEVVCADVTAYDLGRHDAVFVDPARRGARGRVFDPDAYSPPFSFVLGLPGRVGTVGAKVAPGIPHERLPAAAEAEWVSVGGEVKECGLWFGAASSGVRRRATLLPAGTTVTGDGAAADTVGPVARYLYEPDGAVIRAGLVAQVVDEVDGHLVDPRIAYVSGDRLVATGLATAYEVTDVLPFALKPLRSLLRSRGVGRVTVKKRGSPVDPEVLRRQLRLRGDAEATVVVTRVADRPTAILARRLPTAVRPPA